jgi:antitoxin ParD1/3/4
MVVSIPPELEDYLKQAIAAGRFRSAEDAAREAFSLLQDRERRIELLRQDIKAGFDELEHGECIELDSAGLREFFDDVQSRSMARYQASKDA